MDDKLKVFWNLDVLVKMCRSKSDGPSLRIEENEIQEKIEAYSQEIEEIKTISEEDIYDTSSEMADRNIEIITKKQLQTLKNNLKEKNKELNKLKEDEENLYKQTSLLRDNKASQEKYITSMQERISESIENDIIDRYNALIAETSEKIAKLNDNLLNQNTSYNEVQKEIIKVSDTIKKIEQEIDKKKNLLTETKNNLENKENYIDKTKKEKNNKRIVDLENKIYKLNNRLEKLREDPKYLESKIKDIINNKEDISKAKLYLTRLIEKVIKIPYINVSVDNTLEEELLRATQARDTFANEIDQKSYNILEANTPEKVRIEFLNKRITKWQLELEDLKKKINLIDKDQQFNYEKKNIIIADMIKTMKNDLKEFERAYAEAPDINIGAKASLKAALDEKKEDLVEAEKIATAFKKDEAEDIANATRTLKYECDQINKNIYNAEIEITSIKNRLTSKKSGLIDITSRNKDKDVLKELAQIVIDIKHRRSFPETPLEIIKRLEEELHIKIMNDIDREKIENTSSVEPKNYDEYLHIEEEELITSIPEESESLKNEKRGIKVVEEVEINKPFLLLEDDEDTSSTQRTTINLENAIKEENDLENIDLDTEMIKENEEIEENPETPLVTEEIEPIALEETNENIVSNEEQREIANESQDIKIKEENREDVLKNIMEEDKSSIEKKEWDEINPTEEENRKENSAESSEIINESLKQTIPNVQENQNIDLASQQNEQAVIEESMNLENDEALNIEEMLDRTIKNDEIQLSNEIHENQEDDLSINNIFNEKINTNKTLNDNIATNQNLTNELEEYLNTLDN